MATLIEQRPLYPRLPVGQDFIFSLSNTGIVSSQLNVKFVAYVYVSDKFPPITNSTTHLVGTFKTTPNNEGVGMYDFRQLLESYVKSDNLTKGSFAQYKGLAASKAAHPLHLVDKFSKNRNTMRYVSFKFVVEHLDSVVASPTYNTIIEVDEATSDLYEIFNGYVTYSDTLDVNANYDFGLPLATFQPQSTFKKFLSNAPITQYANIEDYGTLAYLGIESGTTIDPVTLQGDPVTLIRFTYLDSAGATLATEDIDVTYDNGAYTTTSPGGWGNIENRLMYFGAFPANLRNWSTTFQGLVTADTIVSYRIQGLNAAGTRTTSHYTININCPDLKGYESVRLCWLNQFGAWDYYTFTKKSTRMISTKGSTYEQLGGTWSESRYNPYGYKGGKKSFRVNATEKITMNTDFVDEAESAWFEELINSPEVYVLEGYKDETILASLIIPSQSTYVQPVRLTTSSYTKKTIANDKLMQYTFEIEKSKTLRTQSI